MLTFKVYGSMRIIGYWIVQAENEDDATEMVYNNNFEMASVEEADDVAVDDVEELV